jgi:KaiC/GvpD/RAD55 family RecA-like ATPase
MTSNVKLLFDLIDKGREGKNIGLKTGIDKLDKHVGGIQRGIYTLIFGLSGAGKSAVSLYMIYRTLRDNPEKDIKYVYFSLEMSSELLLAKLMCLYIYEEFGVVISYTDLMSWESILPDDSYEYVRKSEK